MVFKVFQRERTDRGESDEAEFLSPFFAELVDSFLDGNSREPGGAMTTCLRQECREEPKRRVQKVRRSGLIWLYVSWTM